MVIRLQINTNMAGLTSVHEITTDGLSPEEDQYNREREIFQIIGHRGTVDRRRRGDAAQPARH
jgi:hypothetical protein